MTDMDHNIWCLVQGVITDKIDMPEDDLVIYILKITHGIIHQDDIVREIIRQKRLLIN